MGLISMKIVRFFSISLVFIANSHVFAQESLKTEPSTAPTVTGQPKYIDEVIATGEIAGSNHPGVKDFYEGDFATAEIKFEREFLSLKRRITAIENASFEATNGQIRSDSIAAATGTASSNGQNNLGGNTSQINTSFTPNITGLTSNKVKLGRGVLTDGKVTYNDFSFTKYMTGLSELQLNKFNEAEKSFKTALFYNSKNYDARLRLGLLHLRKREYEKAAKQLEKIDKMRQKCIKTSCDDHKYINSAALELADEIVKIASSKNSE